jgi:hypothetical protein
MLDEVPGPERLERIAVQCPVRSHVDRHFRSRPWDGPQEEAVEQVQRRVRAVDRRVEPAVGLEVVETQPRRAAAKTNRPDAQDSRMLNLSRRRV